VNTFRNPHGESAPQKLELIRSTAEEKKSQLKRLRDFHEKHSSASQQMLDKLRKAVMRNEKRVRGADGRGARLLARADHHALFEVGGQYRRNM